MKSKRHSAILSIISNQSIKTHEQIVSELLKLGFSVTQATVSRDIKELGLIKVPDGEGSAVYAASGMGKPEKHLNIFSGSVLEIDRGMNLVIIRTYPGTASAVAATIDAMDREEILGTIAGDDTVFLAARDEKQGELLERYLKSVFAAS